MEKAKPWSLIPGVGGQCGLSEEHAQLIRQHFHTVCYDDLLISPHVYATKIQAIFMWKSKPVIQRSLLQSLPSLKVISTEGVGFDVDRLDLRDITSRGVTVSEARGAVGDAAADLAVALLLAAARRIVQNQGGLEPSAPTTTTTTTSTRTTSTNTTTAAMPHRLASACDVTGATLGIIGMGNVGYRIARRSTGFEMKVQYHNRTRRSAEDEEAVAAGYCGNVDDLLRSSDYVVLAVNLSPGSAAPLIGHRELSLMKPSAILVNISSGLVVDLDALAKALQSGTIHSAALDVTHPEPLPRGHPLRSLPNVIITPHIGFNTASTVRKMVQKMVQNALAVVTDQASCAKVKSK